MPKKNHNQEKKQGKCIERVEVIEYFLPYAKNVKDTKLGMKHLVGMTIKD